MESAPLLALVDYGDGSQRMSILQFRSLTRWLRFVGIVVWAVGDHPKAKYMSSFSRYVVPAIIPFVFFSSSLWGDYFCYGKVSGCGPNYSLYGNVAYNSKTIYIWLGMLLGIITLHVNCFLFTRSGKLEVLFERVRYSHENEMKVRNAFRFWAACCSLVVIGAILASVVFVSFRIRNEQCTQRFLLCLLPQSIQIISGVCVILTGISLIHIICILLGMIVKQEKEKQLQLLKESNLHQYVLELEGLKKIIKKACEDIQMGNAIELSGGFICIFASLWTFTETYILYSKDSSNIPPAFSLAIWTLIGSLLLTFFVLYSFANITKACDQLLESTKSEIAQYSVKHDRPNVSQVEFFVILSTWQQRFGFHIFGVLMQPEVVRALASAAITVAATIIKLVVPT